MYIWGEGPCILVASVSEKEDAVPTLYILYSKSAINDVTVRWVGVVHSCVCVHDGFLPKIPWNWKFE